MKFVIAMDSFKDCASSIEIGQAVSKGVRAVFPDAETKVFPIADGGEGTIESLLQGLGGSIQKIEILDPLGNNITSYYGILSDGTAVIEMATASGLELVPIELRNPMYTSTYGTGQLISHALDMGATNFIVGIGGSATNDAGMGMLTALGVKFYDKNGNELRGKGEDLIHIYSINIENINPKLKDARIQVACDVNNPLYGSNGAAYIYGPQKGANKETIEFLDRGLQNFAQKTEDTIHKDISQVPGAGAAGGLGAALLAYCGAELISGITIILEYLQIDKDLSDADCVFVGEGKMDWQTCMGKAPSGIANRMKALGKNDTPIIAISGGIKDDPIELHEMGISAYFSIVPGPINLEDALKKENALDFVQRQSREICYIIKSFSP